MQRKEISPSFSMPQPDGSATKQAPVVQQPEGVAEADGDYLPSDEDDALPTTSPAIEETGSSHNFDARKYKHLFKDTSFPKNKILELLSQNPDIKKAVDVVKKTLDAKLTHFDGMKIS